jgi:hypothetical protein
MQHAFPAVFTIITINPFIAPMVPRPTGAGTRLPGARRTPVRGVGAQEKMAPKVPEPSEAAPPAKAPAPKSGVQTTAPAAKPTTRVEAQELMINSEGRPGPGSNVGHTGDHVALKGQDPKALARSRPTKPNTTTWRSSRQAEQDLRDIINANKQKIDALPPDGVTTTGGTHRLSESRFGYNSEFGGPAKDVTFNNVTWRIARMPDGRLHLVHFAPH